MFNKILGIDFGLSQAGLSFSDGLLAQPFGSLKTIDIDNAITKIAKIVEKQGIDKIVIGISERDMAKKTKEFGEKIKNITGKQVIYQDETLTSFEAKQLMVKSGKPRKKRRSEEHQVAACMILQDFLDSL